ncbi:uncharacterized protein LOC113375256 [Ctenocephalides felis]|uniref:uncharacterized protein LOC113375256 n=1 Tax=Ctenocephalides felis TaxID=7515 RepID=UPI000E6E2875|nr:uncharacterized protein LOC113375256 [Ctenocephalides felis]
MSSMDDPESPLEEVSGALYGKGVQFMMTHDMELQLPEMLFDSATLKVSPRGFEGSGAIVKLELMPMERSLANTNGEGRIFIFKKIKQFLKNKLMMAFIAAVLIINLIKFKVLFLLPMMMGVGPAKKVMMKILLFLFPALSHIFKLCHYYHSNYHSTKFVHHQHHIKHLHHTVPHISYDSPHSPVELDHPPVELDHPPHHPHVPYELQLAAHDSGHKPHELPVQPAPYEPSHTEYDYPGPAFGAPSFAFDTHRNSYVHQPKPEDINEINEWGLGVTGNSGYSYPTNPYIAHHPRPGSNKTGNKRLQAQASNVVGQYGPVVVPPSKNKHLHQAALIRAAQIKEAQKLQAEQLRLQNEQKLLAQQHLLNQQIAQTTDLTQYDAFYSPILTKIDAVLEKLGHRDAGCKERILCAMYKNPMKYSPHSNLVSAELSR